MAYVLATDPDGSRRFVFAGPRCQGVNGVPAEAVMADANLFFDMILPEHRARHVAAVSGKRAKRYLQREHLLALGRAALEYLTELTHRRPQVWIHDVDRLHELLQLHGEAALRAAFERGLAEGVFGAEYVAHHLAAAPLPTGTGQQELPL